MTEQAVIPGSNAGTIVYGGAFDPPHQGHIDCVKLAAQHFPSAQFMIVPAFEPAGAAGQHKRTTANFATRIELCRAAFAPNLTGIEAGRLVISPIEEELPRPSYTVATLSALAKAHPDRSWQFLVGQDQLESFHRWHEPIEILRLASLVVIKRDTTSGYGGLLKKSVEQLAERLGEPIEWRAGSPLTASSVRPQAFFTGLGSWIYTIDQPICIAASSLIRELLQKNQRLPAGWMPESVMTYIKDHDLYR